MASAEDPALEVVAVAAAVPMDAPVTKPRKVLPGVILLVIVGAQTMLVLDGTIVNIALPRMGEYFDKSQADMTWAVSAYTLAFGGLLLLGGRAGDILGRRRMLMVGIGLFTFGSLLGGLATGFEILRFGRVLQGVGAAIASPMALALLMTEFEEGPARTGALAVYAAVQGAGGAVGVLLGGVLTEFAGWRWVLFVNVPIGLILLPASYLFLHESGRQPGRFDWFGAALSVGGMVSLVYGFITAAKPGYGWRDPVTLGALALAALLLGGFVFWESRARHAMMPLRLFGNRSRSGAYIATLTIGGALAGMFFFVTFFIQLVLGFSALRNGAANLPIALMVAVGAVVSGKLLPRIGPRNVVFIGCGFVAASLFWLSRVSADSGYLDTVLPAMLLFAFGTGQVFVPLTTVVATGVDEQDMGLASALLNVGQQVGGAIGVSLLATVFATGLADEARHQVHVLGVKVHTGSAKPAVLEHFASIVQQGLAATPSARNDQTALHAARTAVAHGSGLAFLLAAILALAGGLVGRFMINLRREEFPRKADDAPSVT
jgi:EmrB/QacA subfamily drug resistance transporter